MTRSRSTIAYAVRRDVLAAGACAYCGDRYGPFEVEHVRPVCRGGGDGRDNLACVCVSCNSQKRSMLLHEWVAWRVTNGMTWPPIAQHATDPVHYQDDCEKCWDLDIVSTCIPRELRAVSDGYGGVYRCDRGHVWKCWWMISPWFYPDCPCGFCTVARNSESRTAREWASL